MEKPRRLLPNELNEMEEPELNWILLKTVEDIYKGMQETAPTEYIEILKANLVDINKYIAENQRDS